MNSSPKLIEFSEGRKNNFDFLRFLFASLVCFAHSHFLLRDKPFAGDWLEVITHKQTNSGSLSVQAFFIISGYLITASWTRSKGVWDYLKKRILRIYPAFIVACLFCIFIVGPVLSINASQYFHSIKWGHFLIDLFSLNKMQEIDSSVLVHGNQSVSQLNGSIWTIKIEFECYLLIALLGMTKLLKDRRIVLGICCLFYFMTVLNLYPSVLAHVPKHDLIAHLSEHFSFGTSFLIGALFFLYRESIPVSRIFALAAGAVLIVFTPLSQLALVLQICVAYLIFFFAFNKNLKLQNWGEKRDLSYGIYLYAWPMKLIYIRFFGAWLNPYTLFMLALPSAIALAFLSWHFIEKPALSLKTTLPSQAS